MLDSATAHQTAKPKHRQEHLGKAPLSQQIIGKSRPGSNLRPSDSKSAALSDSICKNVSQNGRVGDGKALRPETWVPTGEFYKPLLFGPPKRFVVT
jgi:hypothetical protein